MSCWPRVTPLWLAALTLGACVAEVPRADGGAPGPRGSDAADAAGDARTVRETGPLDAKPRDAAGDTRAPDGGPIADATAPPDAAPPLTWSHDSTANTSRTFYGDRQGRVIFAVSFTTGADNEKRRVRAQLVVNQADLASGDPLMMVAASVSCRMQGSSAHSLSLGNTQNVIKGTTLTLEPQLIYEAGPAGSYSCQVAVQGGRPRPTGSYDSTRFVVDSGSSISVSSPVHAAAEQSYAPQTISVVLDDGDAFDAAPLSWTAPAGVNEFYAFGAVKLTACTAVGGSDDPYDSLGDLCGLPAHEIDTAGTNAIVSFKILQYATGSGYCAETSVPASGGSVHVSKDTHHRMVYREAGSVGVSSAPGCTRTFRVKLYVKQTSGASVVLHKQGTISGVVPL